jgi:nucleotide-binding universal stress UspA family protein
MEDKLVTLAIHTFEKAQVLKTMLETEGIEVYLHNVNQIQPVVATGVRVRIKESDLSHALRIIEDNRWMEKQQAAPVKAEKESRPQSGGKLLIPVDFSDYSMKTCEIGFKYAREAGLGIVILHAYNNPNFPASVPIGDTLFPASETLSTQAIREQAERDMQALFRQIDERIRQGRLPEVPYEYSLREGLPEDEITAYCKSNKPVLVVMGTRGKSQKDFDMLGSVTGEVIEANRTPLLAIPENAPYNDLEKMRHFAFATSFIPGDLQAFDEFMRLTKGCKAEIHLFNISSSHDEWNEIRLGGIHEYLQKLYPGARLSHTVLEEGDLLLAIEKFVRDEHIDLIALDTRRRNVLARMFNPSIARKMLFHTDTTMLVLHA